MTDTIPELTTAKVEVDLDAAKEAAESHVERLLHEVASLIVMLGNTRQEVVDELLAVLDHHGAIVDRR